MPQIDSDLLRISRERMGWTQEDLAAKAGVDTRTIQRLEQTGRARLSTIGFVSSALGLQPQELLKTEFGSESSDSESNNSPEHSTHDIVLLNRIETASKLLDMCCNSHGILPDMNLITDSSDAAIAAELIDHVIDWEVVWFEMSYTERLEASYNLQPLLNRLHAKGWWIFGANHTGQIPFPDGKEPFRFSTAVLVIERPDAARVMHNKNKDVSGMFAMIPRTLDLNNF